MLGGEATNTHLKVFGRRTAMTRKTWRQTMIYKTLHRKLKSEEHKPH
jgi:hypothetical protein